VWCYYRKYVVEKYTQQLRVPFYVKQDFNSVFKGNMRKLEEDVEEEYVVGLKSNCFKERTHST
jgi:DnaJ family protein B protein 12